MKSNAELQAELDALKSEMPSLLDKEVGSPEVDEWVKKVLKIKESLSKKIH